MKNKIKLSKPEIQFMQKDGYLYLLCDSDAEYSDLVAGNVKKHGIRKSQK